MMHNAGVSGAVERSVVVSGGRLIGEGREDVSREK